MRERAQREHDPDRRRKLEEYFRTARRAYKKIIKEAKIKMLREKLEKATLEDPWELAHKCERQFRKQ